MSWPSCLRLLVADVCIHVEVRAEAFLPWSELEQWSYGDAALAVLMKTVNPAKRIAEYAANVMPGI